MESCFMLRSRNGGQQDRKARLPEEWQTHAEQEDPQEKTTSNNFYELPTRGTGKGFQR